jgi:hypothetical protein
MDTLQIMCALRNVKSFAGVFPSDLLPPIARAACTVIINADPHTENGSHWLAVRFLPKSFGAYYFDSYGMVPLVPAIREFLRRNCTVWHYNKRRLQGPTSNVCGKYCCLFALYIDRGYTPQQFVVLFDAEKVDQQIERAFASEFGPLHGNGSDGQSSSSLL